MIVPLRPFKRFSLKKHEPGGKTEQLSHISTLPPPDRFTIFHLSSQNKINLAFYKVIIAYLNHCFVNYLPLYEKSQIANLLILMFSLPCHCDQDDRQLLHLVAISPSLHSFGFLCNLLVLLLLPCNFPHRIYRCGASQAHGQQLLLWKCHVLQLSLNLLFGQLLCCITEQSVPILILSYLC